MPSGPDADRDEKDKIEFKIDSFEKFGMIRCIFGGFGM